MKQLFKVLAIVVTVLLGWIEGNAQNISNKGTDFWVGFGHHQYMETGSNTMNMVLYLSAEEQAATVTVTIHNSGPFPGAWFRRTYTIPAYTVIATENMPKGIVNAAASGSDPNYDTRLWNPPPPVGNGGAGLFTERGIHIESSVPIVAYAHIYGSASSGATMLLPVEAWGYSYVSVNTVQSYASNCYNWMYIIASEDNTVVEITPSVKTRAQDKTGLQPGVTTAVTLMKGEIYQVIGANDAADAYGNGGTSANGKNLTGTKVRSIAGADGECHPVAVFAGSSRTSNPAACGSGGGDNDNQQLFPVHAWGKRYLTAPFANSTDPNISSWNTYKIAVKDPTTQVKRNGAPIPVGSLINGSYYQFESRTADFIEADKPILVVQFLTGGSGCLGASGSVGDPEMVVLSPIEQAIKQVGFYRNTNEGITVNYLSLILPTAGVSSLRIDNSNVFSRTYPHPNLPGYTVVLKRWTAAKTQVLVRCDSAFNATTYGLGSVESYAYSAGAYINNLNAVSGLHNELDTTKDSHEFACVGSPVELSVLMRYKPIKLVFELSTLGAAITPNADVTINPASSIYKDSVTVNGIGYYKYSLPGTYYFNTPGKHRVTIKSTSLTIDNCNNTEEIFIEYDVRPRPRADFSFRHSGCTLDTIYFAGPDTTAEGYQLASWKWQLTPALLDSGRLVKHVLPPGIHNIAISVITNDGCASDTIKSITVHPKPTTSFAGVPPGVCISGNINFTPTSNYYYPDSLNVWFWDFGNGDTLRSATAAMVSNMFDSAGVYTVKQVAKFGQLCISDTAFQVVNVYAKPNLNFTYPAGCLPADGVVQFTSNASTPDGQAMASHSWNFGDANATPANPNTSILANPTHMYSDYGNYTITYSATTANGCTKDTIVQALFNVRPQLAFAALSSVCQNSADLSVARASVTNAVPGTGYYKGPATTFTGNFSPTAAGPGLHRIWYVFSSTAGCIDSIFQDIQVYARPVANFSYPNSGCLPPDGLVQFVNASTIADAQMLTWAWNFGDANANAGNPNTSILQNPSHQFLEGTYTIKLTVTSSSGCIKDTTIISTFSLTPALSFAALPAVCENVAPISVASATVTNGATGTGSYSGPGTSSAGMFDPAVAGPGPHTITYTFTTTGGCVLPITQTIFVNAKPKPNFNFTTGCLTPDGLVQFTNSSTIADAQTLTWAWNFNDPNATAGNPNSSTAQHPTHYFKEGNFPVQLTATSSNGCVKDTTIMTTFAVNPVLSFPALPGVCQNPNATPTSIAIANVTNGITGTGVYSGAGTNSAGLFDPNLAGPGLHPITYTFITAGGCTNTISSTIEVYPRPAASFTTNSNDICLGSDAVLTSTATIGSGNITSWNWDLGNGNNVSYSNGNSFIVSYSAVSNYTVSLVAVSDRGCFSLPATRTIGVHAIPVVDFTLPSGICMPGGNAVFGNGTIDSDNSGLTYSWDFGDGGYSTATNPTYVYGSAGSYNVTLIATSNFGCTSQNSKVLDDFYDKPIANFTVSPQDLCQGQDNLFTDNSTAPNSSIQSWNWDFADNSNSNLPNPTKRFNAPGVYDVKLTVTNSVGCVSDPFVVQVRVHLQPVIDAGRALAVPLGASVQLLATSNSQALTFNWDPASTLNDPTLLRPVATPTQDQVYTLTATGENGCTATDYTTIKILKPVKVPNIFTPNGDNIHDRWEIPNLADYPGCTVEIFNRYGQSLLYSAGYSQPWDGTYKGKPMPVGTYYYVIQLQNGFKPMTGSVTIVR